MRENALAKSQVVNDDDDDATKDDGEVFVINAKTGKRELKPLKPLLPNSGRLIFDDQRWTFIPNGRSLKGPPKVEKKRLQGVEACFESESQKGLSIVLST